MSDHGPAVRPRGGREQCLGEHDDKAGSYANFRHIHQMASIEATKKVHLCKPGSCDYRRVLELGIGCSRDHVGVTWINHTHGEINDKSLEQGNRGRSLLGQVAVSFLLHESADDDVKLIQKA